jgi:hypothetical protein
MLRLKKSTEPGANGRLQNLVPSDCSFVWCGTWGRSRGFRGINVGVRVVLGSMKVILKEINQSSSGKVVPGQAATTLLVLCSQEWQTTGLNLTVANPSSLKESKLSRHLQQLQQGSRVSRFRIYCPSMSVSVSTCDCYRALHDTGSR